MNTQRLTNFYRLRLLLDRCEFEDPAPPRTATQSGITQPSVGNPGAAPARETSLVGTSVRDGSTL